MINATVPFEAACIVSSADLSLRFIFRCFARAKPAHRSGDRKTDGRLWPTQSLDTILVADGRYGLVISGYSKYLVSITLADRLVDVCTSRVLEHQNTSEWFIPSAVPLRAAHHCASFIANRSPHRKPQNLTVRALLLVRIDELATDAVPQGVRPGCAFERGKHGARLPAGAHIGGRGIQDVAVARRTAGEDVRLRRVRGQREGCDAAVVGARRVRLDHRRAGVFVERHAEVDAGDALALVDVGDVVGRARRVHGRRARQRARGLRRRVRRRHRLRRRRAFALLGDLARHAFDILGPLGELADRLASRRRASHGQQPGIIGVALVDGVTAGPAVVRGARTARTTVEAEKKDRGIIVVVVVVVVGVQLFSRSKSVFNCCPAASLRLTSSSSQFILLVCPTTDLVKPQYHNPNFPCCKFHHNATLGGQAMRFPYCANLISRKQLEHAVSRRTRSTAKQR
nr:hypothetical protein CFP56_20896 [Quercus suber]